MYVCKLEDLVFEKKYDCIFFNWGLCYLNDNNLDEFLVKARLALLPDKSGDKPGMLVFKESVRKED